MYGMKINLNKCGLAEIDLDEAVIGEFASLVGCQIQSWLLPYLRVPLGGNP